MTSADIAGPSSTPLTEVVTNNPTTQTKKLPFGHVLTPQVSEALKTYQNVTFEEDYGKQLPAPIPSPTPSYEWKDMVIESVLGQGSFSFVFQVSVASSSDSTTTTTTTHKKMALKCLKASAVETSEDLIYNAMDLYSEANLLERLQHSSTCSPQHNHQHHQHNHHHHQHPHIIQLLGTCRTPLASSFARDDGYFVLLEVIQDTLQERLDHWRKIDDDATFAALVEKSAMQRRLRSIALPVADAMRYLHRHKIVVRDLKPENVGFDNGTMQQQQPQQQQQQPQVKLFDFGLARSVDLLKNETTLAGSVLYMAPEVLQIGGVDDDDAPGKNTSIITIDTSSDVYSFAILVWELCTLEVPFRKCTTLRDVQVHVLQKRKRPNLAGIPSSKVKSFIQRLWKQDAKDRPSFEQIVPMLENMVGGGTNNNTNSGTAGVAGTTDGEEENSNTTNANKPLKKRTLSKFFSRS